MMSFSKYIKVNKTIFIIGFLVLALIPLSYAFSQESEVDLILTWKAQNFYPSNYQGKALVVKRSKFLVSATGVLNNDFIDLSNGRFTWYVDGSLYKRENGAEEIIFESNKSSGDDHFVRLVIELNNRTIRETITVPVNKSKSVIVNSSISKSIEEGSEKTLKSTPYFFNVNSIEDLSFWWEINSQVQKNKNRTITINSNDEDLGGGQNLIRSIIGNDNNQLESARSTIQLNYNR